MFLLGFICGVGACAFLMGLYHIMDSRIGMDECTSTLRNRNSGKH